MTPFGPIADHFFSWCILFLVFAVIALVLVVVIRQTGSPDGSPWKRSRRDDEPPDT